MNLNDLIRAVNDMGAGADPIGVSDEVRSAAAAMVGKSVRKREDKDLRPGDLVSLTSEDKKWTMVVMGSLDLSGSESEDPILPVGTVCTVVRRLDDPLITSQPAFVVLAEVEGRVQQLWAYAAELTLESRCET